MEKYEGLSVKDVATKIAYNLRYFMEKGYPFDIKFITTYILDVYLEYDIDDKKAHIRVSGRIGDVELDTYLIPFDLNRYGVIGRGAYSMVHGRRVFMIGASGRKIEILFDAKTTKSFIIKEFR
jgi:hypothetical protein